MKKKVLILGSTGRVGQSLICEYLENHVKDYELIIGYHRKKTKCGLNFRKYSLNNLSSLKRAMKDVDVVVNLAANSNEKASFQEILEPNIVGVYNVFEAARQTRVKRVIFASSVHAIKGYPVNYKVREKDVPKPSGFYGASKVWGENLCYIYSQKYNLSCLAIRIGAYTSNEEKEFVCINRQDYHYVITQDDLGELIHKCIMAPESVKFGILAGISNNTKKNMDLKFTKKLVGYKPKDNAYKMCHQIKKKVKKRK